MWFLTRALQRMECYLASVRNIHFPDVATETTATGGSGDPWLGWSKHPPDIFQIPSVYRPLELLPRRHVPELVLGLIPV